MSYEELMEAGRRLTPKQVEGQLRELARDDRFAAVLAWLERNHRAWVASVSDQRLAKDHGALAHASGSLHALELLTAQLQTTLATSGGKRQSLSEMGPDRAT